MSVMASSLAPDKTLTLSHIIRKKFVHFPHPQCIHSKGGSQKSTTEQPVYCEGLFLSFRFPTGELVHGSLNYSYSEAIKILLQAVRGLVKLVLDSPELESVPPFEKSTFYPTLDEIPEFPYPEQCNCKIPSTCSLDHIQQIPKRDDSRYIPLQFSKLPDLPRHVEMPPPPQLIHVGSFALPTQLARIPDRSEFVPPHPHLLAKVGKPFSPPSLIQAFVRDARVTVGILSVMGIGTHFPDVLNLLEKMAEVCDGLICVYSQFSYEIHHKVLNSSQCTERLNSCTIAHMIRIRSEPDDEADDAFADFDFAVAAVAFDPGGRPGPGAPLPSIVYRATHFLAAYLGFGRSIKQRGVGADAALEVTPIDLNHAAEPRSPELTEPGDPDQAPEAPPAWCRKVPVPTRKDFLPQRPRLPRLPAPPRRTIADLPDAEAPPVWAEPVLGADEQVDAPRDVQWDPVCRDVCLGLSVLPEFVEPELEVPPLFELDADDADRRFPLPPPPHVMEDELGGFQPQPYPPDLPDPPRWLPDRQIEPVCCLPRWSSTVRQPASACRFLFGDAKLRCDGIRDRTDIYKMSV